MTTKRPHPPHVVVAPLDWGIGHATRCIPIITTLLELGCRVTLAADGRPLALLKREFPELDTLILHGYNIAYPNAGSMALAMARQLPKIWEGITRERESLIDFHRGDRVDLAISDNRFGCSIKGVPSVYLTHQLTIRMPPALRGLEPITRIIHCWMARHFDEVWVPDYAGEPNLAGELSHPPWITPPVHFIGPLTRFIGDSEPDSHYEVVAIISGPEPQRTIFERLLLDQLPRLPMKSLIVLGQTESDQTRHVGTVTVMSHLNSELLERMILGAKAVICRPGYSTLMDLDKLGKRAILVPTPGQTEQEYLAEKGVLDGVHRAVPQDRLELVKLISKSPELPLSTRSQGSFTPVGDRIRAILAGRISE